MHTGNVTTPFGRRPVSLALVRRQQALTEIREGKAANKWQIFRDASACRELLGLQSNSLAVLDALLSFYPENELRQDAQLVVFPSNVQLSLRAHGMPGSTLRRHLSTLVEAGLIVRKDSANGKRYARKGSTGDVENAFGFDLSPLLARSEEIAALAQQVFKDRAAFREVKENLTICRRDVRKLISAAMEEGIEGDWLAIEGIFVGLLARLPRTPSVEVLAEIFDEMEMLKEEILNRLESKEENKFSSTKDAHNGRHIQNSKTDPIIEFEPSSRKEQGGEAGAAKRDPSAQLKSFPLGIVLKACPQIVDYAPNGVVSTWRDLMSAAVVVRSVLGVSPSAYQEACETMGPENAAVAVACILERANMITSAGGYLRDLTRKADRGEFSLRPMIMAALRANGGPGLKAG